MPQAAIGADRYETFGNTLVRPIREPNDYASIRTYAIEYTECVIECYILLRSLST